MRISLINPNTTRSMTDKAVAAAEIVAAPDTVIAGYTSRNGPAAIQGAADGEAALPGLYAEVERALADGSDGIAIACFDDTGLATVRGMCGVPVFGIGEAGYRMAAMVAPRFSVVTTLSISVPVLEGNIHAYGLDPFCARVRASEVAVLELEEEGSDAQARVSREVDSAIREDGCGAVVLGCCGMVSFAETMTLEHGIPVLDGVVAAVKLLEACHALALAPRS